MLLQHLRAPARCLSRSTISHLAQYGLALIERQAALPDHNIFDPLNLETAPRKLITALVEKIEIGEQYPDTGEQQSRITRKF